MKCSNSLVGDVVANDAPELRRQRQHGAKHFADGGNVILGDPAAQLHEFRSKSGSRIEHLAEAPRLEFRFAVVQFGDDAAQPLLAEGHNNAAADAGLGVGNAIGEGGVEGDGQRHIAELRHDQVNLTTGRGA